MHVPITIDGDGSGTVTNYRIRGGAVYHNTVNTTAAVEVFGGTFDGSQDVRSKTITLLTKHRGAKKVTVDNGLGNITLTTLVVLATEPPLQTP